MDLLWKKKMLQKAAQEQDRGIHKAHLKAILAFSRGLGGDSISNAVKSSSDLVKMLDESIESINTSKASGDILKEEERSHKPLFLGEPGLRTEEPEQLPDEQR